MSGNRRYHLLHLLDSVWNAATEAAKKETQKSSATRVIEGILIKHFGLENENNGENGAPPPVEQIAKRAAKKAKKRSNGDYNVFTTGSACKSSFAPM